MSPTQLDPLAAVNPLTDDAARRLAIHGAEDEMLARIVAGGDVHDVAPAWSRSSARSRRALALAGLIAAAAVPVLVVLALVPTGRDHQGRAGRHAPPQPIPTTRHADARLAGASPRVLLQAPGWTVARADEMSRLWGELDLQHAGSPSGGGLSWFPAADTRGYIEDRGSEALTRTTMPLLGTTAHVYQAKGPRRHGTFGFTAIWTMGSFGLMFEGGAPNLRAFRALLGHLHVVDYATWLQALPKSVVTWADRGETIRRMLKGVPLPPGFKVSQIPGATLVRDRYQLGTAVSGTVACEWFASWGHARRTGDQAAVNRAIAAMATAVHWRVLTQMRRDGGWPSVLIGYAKAMPSGRWYGRPLLGDVNSGLGCSREWHVRLGGA